MYSETPVREQSAARGLRSLAVKGGAFVALRQAFGAVLSVVTVLLVTRAIGPFEYGLFAASAAVVVFVARFCSLGIDVYLIRKPGEIVPAEYSQALTTLALLGLIGGGLVFVFRVAIASAIHLFRLQPVLGLLALYIPLDVLSLPAEVQLDRALRFRRVAFNELASQTLNCFVAVTLAYRGFGAWAPTWGLVVQQIGVLAFSYSSVRFSPVWHWDKAKFAEMIRYGTGYSASIWIWQLRTLVNPVIVGRFAGAEAVGFVALAIRITDLLSLAKSATWRVAMAALAKLSQDGARLRRSVEEGMRLQALAVGLPLATFALLAPLLMPAIFGHRWDGTIRVFPFIAIGVLCNSIFLLHSSVLYLFGRNISVAWFHAVHVLSLGGAALILVPRIGYMGYGWAEIIALLSYVVIHNRVAIVIESPKYSAALLWFSVTAGGLIASAGSPLLAIFGVLLLLSPLLISRERSVLKGYFQEVFSGDRA